MASYHTNQNQVCKMVNFSLQIHKLLITGKGCMGSHSLCALSPQEDSSSSLIDKLVFWFHRAVSEGGIIKPALKDALSRKGLGNSFLLALRHKRKHSSLNAKIMNASGHLWDAASLWPWQCLSDSTKASTGQLLI